VPFATRNGTRLYWESHGTGEPFLLVMGLSFTLDMWYRIIPLLEPKYRLIVFDNRGVGRSDVPPGPYSIGNMAEDAMAVLDAAGVREPALLLGASMGGMIAQEMALRYQDRFRALVLACTTCDPLYRGAWPKWQHSPGFLHWLRLKGEARERALVRLLYSDTTPLEKIEEDIRVRATRQPPVRVVLNQLAGILAWSSYRRLPGLTIPTLVAHGEHDHILPPSNGRMVAAQIPNAEFALLQDAGHMIITDQPETAVEILERFLEHLRGSSRSPQQRTRDQSR
jgi:pimeloyl-ACP methyl ester carboxylesterase